MKGDGREEGGVGGDVYTYELSGCTFMVSKNAGLFDSTKRSS